MHTFKIAQLICPNLHSNSHFLKIWSLFWVFYIFLSLMWLPWVVSWVFQRIRTINLFKNKLDLVKYLEAKNDQKLANKWYILSLTGLILAQNCIRLSDAACDACIYFIKSIANMLWIWGSLKLEVSFYSFLLGKKYPSINLD